MGVLPAYGGWPRKLVCRLVKLLITVRTKPLGTDRLSEPQSAKLYAGTIEMQTSKWTVTVDGEPVELTYLEYRLLQELILAQGNVLSRETLLQRVWGYDNTLLLETRTVDVHMGRLRRKLGESGKHVITVRNVGYRMAISPHWIIRDDDH